MSAFMLLTSVATAVLAIGFVLGHTVVSLRNIRAGIPAPADTMLLTGLIVAVLAVAFAVLTVAYKLSPSW